MTPVAHQNIGRDYLFGPFRYDSEQRLLFRDSELAPLAPKTIDTLHVLLERRGQVVEKAELMRLVWPDCTVEDVGLARNISLLRKALGDEQELYIATIPKRGYRFTVEPAAAAAPDEASVSKEQPPVASWLSRNWRWVAAGLIILAAVIAWQSYYPSRYLPHGEVADLAVVPIEALSSDLDGAGFARGFTDALSGEISKLDSVRVISPGTVARYEQFRLPTPVMARMLRLDATVEGTAQRNGSRLRISLFLKDVRTGKLIWADNYDRDASDLARAQIEVAQAAAAGMRSKLARK